MRIKTFGVFIATLYLLWPSVAGATFSIIARDSATGEVGYAVASRVFAVRLSGGVIDPEAGVARQADVHYSVQGNLLVGPEVIDARPTRSKRPRVLLPSGSSTRSRQATMPVATSEVGSRRS